MNVLPKLMMSAKRITPEAFAMLASMVLSIIALVDDPVLNRDGMLYVDIARDIVTSGVQAAGRYEWPFISLFLAGPAMLLGIDPILVAHVFLVLAMMLASFLVVGIAREIKSSFVWYAAMFVLCAPVFNDYRADLIRGMGGWPLIFGSVYCLLRWRRFHLWRYSAGYQLCMGGAFLFRPELVAIGAAGGLWVVLTGVRGRRFPAFLTLFGPPVALVSALVVFPLMLDLQIEDRLVKLREIVNLSERIDEFGSKASAIADVALDDYIADDAGQVLFVGMTSLLFSKWATLLGVFTVPLLVSVTRRAELAYRGFFAFMVLSFFLVLLVYLFWSYLLSARYVVPLAMLSLPWVCDGMEFLDQRYLRMRYRAAVIVVVGSLALAGVISTSPGKGYLKQAGEWVESHYSPEDKVYFNDPRVMFYAGFGYSRYRMEESLGDVIDDLSSRNVLVIHAEHDSIGRLVNERLQGLGFSRIRSFSGGEGREVLVFVKNMKSNT